MPMPPEISVHDIIAELEQIPAAYLPNVYNIIHTFRLNVSAPQDDLGVWDFVREDAMMQRQKHNQAQFEELETLFPEDMSDAG
jgi:hypothetical protein